MRIEVLLDDSRVFEAGRQVLLARAGARHAAEIEFVREQHGRTIMKLRGVDSIEQAQSLVGTVLEVPAAELPDPESGSFYTFDLRGCRVTAVDGEELGRVTDVMDWSGTILLKVEGERGEILIPFAKVYLEKVDLSARHIVVDLPEGLRDLNK